MRTVVLFGFFACASLLGCGGPNDSLNGPGGGPGTSSGDPGGGGSNGGTSGGSSGASSGGGPLCTTTGKSYVGFAGTKLEADRVAAPAGSERLRLKPYSALVGEYPRVLGAPAPGLLDQAGQTFGEAPDRWTIEPHASAVSVYTAYRIAFQGCLTYTQTSPDYAAAPTAATAQTACTAMTRAFWSRAANPDELSACVEMATTGSASEADPRRRWAYGCTSVLSAAGFLTY
jgi:hypothetical protein